MQADCKRDHERTDGRLYHVWNTCVHWLGETLFTVEPLTGFGIEPVRRYYVCGLDRNDDPNKRHFYLCRLPEGNAPKTVDEALTMLRPAEVPEGSSRQGEWFFVPAPELSVRRKDEQKQVPIVADKGAEQIRGPVQARRRRHVARRLYVNGAVFVRGKVKDAEHDELDLGEVWHRVIRNLADGSWAAGGVVD
jgi:hypothetical protein